MKRLGITILGTFLMVGQAVSIATLSFTFDRDQVRPIEYIFVTQALMYMLLQTFKLCEEERT